MIYLAAALLLVLLAEICDAVMDTLQHHWSGSVFSRLAGDSLVSWWGHADHVWRRRYQGHDPRQPFTPTYQWWVNQGLGFVYESFADAWHAAKLIRAMAMAGAVGCAALMALEVWASALVALAVFIVGRGAFMLTYKLLKP